MTLAGFIAYSGALALAAAIPGPGITALVARALGSGFRSSLYMALGLILGDLIYLTAVMLGLAIVAQTFGMVFLVVKWAGVAYLAWLAWKMWRAPVGEAPELPQAGSGWRLFGAGLAVTLGNPKIMVFYLALLPAILDLRAVSLWGWAELTAVMLVVLIAVDLCWVLAATQARRLFRTPGGRRLANRLSAGMMAGAAGAMAAR